MAPFASFILAHEDFALSLKNTIEKITGPQDNIYTYSNKTDALPVILNKISKKLSTIESDKIFVFVDLVGGSCWGLANMVLKDHPDVIVIGGVNLPMILSLIINHENLPVEKLVNKIIEDSKKGIKELGRN